MKIKKLDLVNFRCFDSLQVDFDDRMTVLVAPNGAGKSAILDAIAVNLGSFLTRLPGIRGIAPKRETDLRIDRQGKKSPYLRITTETATGIIWDRTVLRDYSKKTKEWVPKKIGLEKLNDYVDSFVDAQNNDISYQLPILAYYGTGRGVFDGPQRRRNFKKQFYRFEAYQGAMEGRANFKLFFEWFDAMEDLERRQQTEKRDFDAILPELDAVRQAIARMFPDFSNPRIETRPLRFLIDWQQESNKQTLHIEQLSDGYRTTLALVMDIAARMAEANPESSNILETKGIVLIDEIDLHLHPQWQQRIIGDLQRTFPKVQFIVSTHSPQVLSTVKREQIRILGTATNGHFFAEPPIAKTYAEPSNDVLQAVMSVDPQPPVPEKKLLERLTELVDQGMFDVDEAKGLFLELEKKISAEHPQLMRLRRTIERQKVLGR